MADIHNLKEFKCDQCEEKFETENSLNRHKKAHDEGAEMIKCGYCPQKFLHNSQKKCHKLTHSSNTKYHCLSALCKDRRGFKNLSGYNMHMQSHSREEFKCKVQGCNYSSNNKHQLSDHMRRQHSELKPYPYVEKGCEYKTRDKRKMKKH